MTVKRQEKSAKEMQEIQSLYHIVSLLIPNNQVALNFELLLINLALGHKSNLWAYAIKKFVSLQLPPMPGIHAATRQPPHTSVDRLTRALILLVSQIFTKV